VRRSQVRPARLASLRDGHTFRQGRCPERLGRPFTGGPGGAPDPGDGVPHRSAVRPAPSRLDLGGRAVARAGHTGEHRPPGNPRQPGGVGHPHHVERVRGGQHPKAQRDREVRPQVRADRPAGALRGEDEVHAERASLGGEPDQGGEEVGVLVGEGAELVDHHEQPPEPGGRRGTRVVPRREAAVVREVARPDRREEPFPSDQLGA